MKEVTAKDLAQYKLVNIDSIKPYDKNPYTMTDKAREAIKFSIEKYGFNVPLVVRQEDMTIASGNKRWAVMKEMGYKQVIVNLKAMSKKEFAGYLAADNQTNKLAQIDNELMDELFEQIGEEELQGMGFGLDEIEARLASDLEDITSMGELEINENVSIQNQESGVKMLQLFLDSSNFEKFIEMVNAISIEGESITDTVVRTVTKAYENNPSKS